MVNNTFTYMEKRQNLKKVFYTQDAAHACMTSLDLQK